MSYSARALELAQELGEVAAANLREIGKEVDHDRETGRFIVLTAAESARRDREAPTVPSEEARQASNAPVPLKGRALKIATRRRGQFRRSDRLKSKS